MAGRAVDCLNEGVFKTSRDASLKTREELDSLLSAKIPKYTSEDTGLVVFGSLAREEWTSGSDLDWTYLIDGQANSDHLRIVQAIQNVLKEDPRFKAPGATETFGNMTFSHDLIHQSAARMTRTRTPPVEFCSCSNPFRSVRGQRLTTGSCRE